MLDEFLDKALLKNIVQRLKISLGTLIDDKTLNMVCTILCFVVMEKTQAESNAMIAQNRIITRFVINLTKHLNTDNNLTLIQNLDLENRAIFIASLATTSVEIGETTNIIYDKMKDDIISQLETMIAAEAEQNFTTLQEIAHLVTSYLDSIVNKLKSDRIKLLHFLLTIKANYTRQIVNNIFEAHKRSKNKKPKKWMEMLIKNFAGINVGRLFGTSATMLVSSIMAPPSMILNIPIIIGIGAFGYLVSEKAMEIVEVKLEISKNTKPKNLDLSGLLTVDEIAKTLEKFEEMNKAVMLSKMQVPEMKTVSPTMTAIPTNTLPKQPSEINLNKTD